MLEGHGSCVFSVAWSSNGWLASGSCNGTVKIWDPITGQCRAPLEHRYSAVRSVAWSSDGELASGSHNGNTKIWDPTTGQCMATLKGHVCVRSIAWSNDGRLAYGSLNVIIDIGDPAAGQCKPTLSGQCKSMLTGIGTGLKSATWLGNNWLASIHDGDTVKIWNPPTDQREVTIENYRDILWSITWFNNNRIAAGSADRAVKIWIPGQYTAAIEFVIG